MWEFKFGVEVDYKCELVVLWVEYMEILRNMEKEVFVLKEDKKVLEVELMICGDFGYVGELLID